MNIWTKLFAFLTFDSRDSRVSLAAPDSFKCRSCNCFRTCAVWSRCFERTLKLCFWITTLIVVLDIFTTWLLTTVNIVHNGYEFQSNHCTIYGLKLWNFLFNCCYFVYLETNAKCCQNFIKFTITYLTCMHENPSFSIKRWGPIPFKNSLFHFIHAYKLSTLW